MELIEQLKAYNFADFKRGGREAQGLYIAEVMEEIPINSENHMMMKEKMDRELGFDKEMQSGISYPALIKYLALVLEDMENIEKADREETNIK